MQTFEMTLKNKANKTEFAQARIQVLDDRRWNLALFGTVLLPDNQKAFFNYVRQGVDWQDDNPRLEKYLRHRIKVAVGKDILNQPDCPITDKNKFWKENTWLTDFDQKRIKACW